MEIARIFKYGYTCIVVITFPFLNTKRIYTRFRDLFIIHISLSPLFYPFPSSRHAFSFCFGEVFVKYRLILEMRFPRSVDSDVIYGRAFMATENLGGKPSIKNPIQS
jgi:hypothetical protein